MLAKGKYEGLYYAGFSYRCTVNIGSWKDACLWDTKLGVTMLKQLLGKLKATFFF